MDVDEMQEMHEMHGMDEMKGTDEMQKMHEMDEMCELQKGGRPEQRSITHSVEGLQVMMRW